MEDIKLGADPEVFIMDTQNWEIVSVEGMIKTDDGFGTKSNPLEIEKGFSIQEDNVLAEFNIPPASTKSEWTDNLKFGLHTLNVVLPDFMTCHIKSSHDFDPKYLKTQQSLEAGCEPQICVYDMKEYKPKYEDTLRAAGGHVHVGYNNADNVYNLKVITQAVKSMDLFLGVPSLLLDEDTKRRSVYGQAGSFRYKDYGFEYRTLSNFWLKTKELQEWVWEQTHKAINNKEEVPAIVQDIINNNDINKAIEFCEEYKINVPITQKTY